MGGDGGQVIDRATMVKCKGYGLTKGSGNRYANSLGEMANYVQMVSEDRGYGYLENRANRLQTCILTQQPLREPIVACRLGNLYNKEALIGALLNKSMPAELSHVRALKDVKTCVVKWADNTQDVEGGDANESIGRREGCRRRIVCPMTLADCDAGGSRAVVIWCSGAVVSAKALKEMKLKECPVTGKPFDHEQDIVPLCPDAEELQQMMDRLPVKKRKLAVVSTSTEEKTTDKTMAAGVGEHGKEKRKHADVSDESTDLYKNLFQSKKSVIGEECRDAFGTPSYFRGMRI